jgi:hypothetical protein
MGDFMDIEALQQAMLNKYRDYVRNRASNNEPIELFVCNTCSYPIKSLGAVCPICKVSVPDTVIKIVLDELGIPADSPTRPKEAAS